MSELRSGTLVCLGNPLLDIVASADEKLLEKYNLGANNAILANEKHKTLYNDLVDNYVVEYTAGGAAQNAARITEKVLGVPKVVVFMGCVGQDNFSKILEDKAREDGVDVKYQFTNKQPTGTCAVILTNNGKHRSLCANLAASTLFTIDHIKMPENAEIIKNADFYYVTGFFLIVSPDTAMEIAKKAAAKNKLFIMNLSAPYICHSFFDKLEPLLPYVDIIFGNETEAEAFAEVCSSKDVGFKTKDLEIIAGKISNLPKMNNNRKRLVVLTQGEKPIILCNGNTKKLFDVPRIPAKDIVDTNGAGDAFVGGFLAQLIQNQPYDTCVKCGSWAAAVVIQQSGCIFKTTEKFLSFRRD